MYKRNKKSERANGHGTAALYFIPFFSLVLVVVIKQLSIRCEFICKYFK